MLDPVLARHAPLERHTALRSHAAIREIPFVTKINLRGDPADHAFVRAVAEATGIDLPLQHGRLAKAQDAKALWLGPDEWLIVSDAIEPDDLMARLRSKLAGIISSVVDIGAARTIIALTGPNATEVLAKGCGLDLHPSEFLEERCAQTHLARASVILERIESAVDQSWHIYVANSFAPYLADWLVYASRD